jgi:hypothetical protein
MTSPDVGTAQSFRFPESADQSRNACHFATLLWPRSIVTAPVVRGRAIVAILVLSWWLVPAVPALAQSSSYSDVPDRIVLEAGGFNMFVNTSLTFNSSAPLGFESDLNLPGTVQRGYVEGFWRIARRHQISASYGRLDRTADGTSLGRDIPWGGVVYHAGLTVSGSSRTDVISGTYRFSLYKNPRFEAGPALGFGYLWFTAEVAASATLGGQSNTLDRQAQESTPTGDVGGFANWWVARRVYVRGDLRYILVKPTNSEAAVTQGRASLTWYPWPHLGFGGQYVYDKYRYDRNVRSSQLGGSYRYDGLQIFASVAF